MAKPCECLPYLVYFIFAIPVFYILSIGIGVGISSHDHFSDNSSIVCNPHIRKTIFVDCALVGCIVTAPFAVLIIGIAIMIYKIRQRNKIDQEIDEEMDEFTENNNYNNVQYTDLLNNTVGSVQYYVPDNQYTSQNQFMPSTYYVPTNEFITQPQFITQSHQQHQQFIPIYSNYEMSNGGITNNGLTPIYTRSL